MALIVLGETRFSRDQSGAWIIISDSFFFFFLTPNSSKTVAGFTVTKRADFRGVAG